MQIRETVELKTASLKAAALPIPEAAVVSFCLNFKAAAEVSAAEAAERLAGILTEAAVAICDGGGFIGHIKSFLTFDEGGLGMSIVRDRVDRKDFGFQEKSPAGKFRLAITAIVYGCGKSELQNLLNLGLTLAYPEPSYLLLNDKGSLNIPRETSKNLSSFTIGA